MVKLTVFLLTITLLSSCSQLNPLAFLSGGTNVAANVQAGQTNSQTVGKTNNIAPTVSVRPNARVDSVDQSVSTSKISTDGPSNITVNEVPVWLILLFGLFCGFLIPSPSEIVRSIVGIFNGKRS